MAACSPSHSISGFTNTPVCLPLSLLPAFLCRSTQLSISAPTTVSWSTLSPDEHRTPLVDVPPLEQVYSPDSCIGSLRVAYGLAKPLSSYLRPANPILQTFSGEPRDFLAIIQSSRVEVHETCGSDWERKKHFKACLPKYIEVLLGEHLMQPSIYPHALKKLQRRLEIATQFCVHVYPWSMTLSLFMPQRGSSNVILFKIATRRRNVEAMQLQWKAFEYCYTRPACLKASSIVKGQMCGASMSATAAGSAATWAGGTRTVRKRTR